MELYKSNMESCFLLVWMIWSKVESGQQRNTGESCLLLKMSFCRGLDQMGHEWHLGRGQIVQDNGGMANLQKTKLLPGCTSTTDRRHRHTDTCTS